MIYFHVEDGNGNVIWSNLDSRNDAKRKCIQAQKKRSETLMNTILVNTINGYSLYMHIDGGNISSHEYQRHKEICKKYIESLKVLEDLIIKRESEDHNIFKHNMTNYNAYMLQALYNIVPYDKIPGYNIAEQKEYIKRSIVENIDNISDSFMNLIRFSRFINFEIDIYSFIQGKTFDIEMHKHSIHKLLTLVVQLFLVPYAEKKIKICLENTENMIMVSYSTITIAFYNILHNFGKYVRPNSTIDVEFSNEGPYTVIRFHMKSLKIETNEVNSVFNKGVVGKWAKSSKKNGTGVGMYMAKEMILLNNGMIDFILNEGSDDYYEGFPYQYNILEIRLRNALDDEI
ncbi:hypothetical protein [Bacteroides thetaiotaomicron]|jgi:light-regulated signal transduction histidine kinase (bacteriophytochrome)|uniref:hypothetical protein n=1 Tax=Bacteroides thetaiotaomicron TaxID=818 RepID=UPI0032193A37